MGDYIEILRENKKQGWLDKPERQMQGFCDARRQWPQGFGFQWLSLYLV